MQSASSAPSTKVRLQGSPNQRTSELTAWSVIRVWRLERRPAGRARAARTPDLQLHDSIRQGRVVDRVILLLQLHSQETQAGEHCTFVSTFEIQVSAKPAAHARSGPRQTLLQPALCQTHRPISTRLRKPYTIVCTERAHPHTVTHRVYVPTQRAALSHMRVSRRARVQPCEALTRAPRRSLCSL